MPQLHNETPSAQNKRLKAELASEMALVADLVEALERADTFLLKFREPWGSWKTAWWEGEVSDDAAFSTDNAMMHVANILRAALKQANGKGL